jgi:HK97 family phage prohead protease
MPEDNVPERLVREVTFAVEGDGRTIEARIVPYNTPTKVADAPQHGGTGIPYLERWLPGAFDAQTNAANRVDVWLNFEHEDGFRGIIGHGKVLRSEPDALYGTFRVEPGPDGDKALHLVNEGVLTGLSIEAIPTRTQRTREGIVDRVKARLDKVALCRPGLAAYKGAEVLAVREAPPEDEPEDLAPVLPPDPERSSEVDEVLKRVGVEPLVRRMTTTRPSQGKMFSPRPRAERRPQHPRSRSSGSEAESSDGNHSRPKSNRRSQAHALLPAG